MTFRARSALPAAMSVVFLWWGCGSPAASASLEPPPRGTRGTGSEPAETLSQFSVGLRVALDQRFVPQPEVGVVAVVHDARGESQTIDLGSYLGRVVEGEPVGEELAAVIVRSPEGSGQRISLVPTPEGIEARARPIGGEGEEEVIERIPLPDGAEPVPRQPALEIEPRP